MRILVLNYEYPPLGGGAGVVTKHLAERFAAKGNKVYVLTTWYPGEPELSVHDNLTLIRVKSRRKNTYQSNPREMHSWMKAAIRYINEGNLVDAIDVTLANFTLPGGPVARYIKKKMGIPYVILSHGHDVPWYSPPQMFIWHILTFPWIKRVMKGAYRNVLLTYQLKAAADKFVGQKMAFKNIVIPNGMEAGSFRKGFDKKDGALKILFAGRLVDQKDPITFLKVAAKINEWNIPAEFTMAGDGPLRKEIEHFISHHTISNISVLGKISQSELFELYVTHHVLLMPSKNEAMSMVALEALSCGMYVFSTRVSGSDKMIQAGVTGDFVEKGEVTQIAEKIRQFYLTKYLSNYQYPPGVSSSWGSEHDWDIIADQYLDVFGDAVRLNAGILGS